MDLKTVSDSEIVVKTPEEKLEENILNEEPFMPDTAIYYIDLRSDGNTGLEFVGTDGTKLEESADMILDAQMTVDQAWAVFCKDPGGKVFSEKFVKFAAEDRKEQQRMGFKNLVTCLDKTNTIINSALNPNGA